MEGNVLSPGAARSRDVGLLCFAVSRRGDRLDLLSNAFPKDPGGVARLHSGRFPLYSEGFPADYPSTTTAVALRLLDVFYKFAPFTRRQAWARAVPAAPVFQM